MKEIILHDGIDDLMYENDLKSLRDKRADDNSQTKRIAL